MSRLELEVRVCDVRDRRSGEGIYSILNDEYLVIQPVAWRALVANTTSNDKAHQTLEGVALCMLAFPHPKTSEGSSNPISQWL